MADSDWAGIPRCAMVHPKFVNSRGPRRARLARRINEWLARCGLEWAGHPGTGSLRQQRRRAGRDEPDAPRQGRQDSPRRKWKPWSNAARTRASRVRGRVDERAFDGPKLSSGPRSRPSRAARAFRIEDTLTNAAPTSRNSRVIYHVNPWTTAARRRVRGSSAADAMCHAVHARAGREGCHDLTRTMPGRPEASSSRSTICIRMRTPRGAPC